MPREPGSNPYLRWLLARQSFPRVWQCSLATVVLWIVSSTITLRLLKTEPTSQGPAASFLWLFGIGTTLASLLAVTTFSVLLTQKEVHSERRQLLRLASYPSRRLIRDYTFNTIYRLRPLLVLALGLSPTLAPGWTHYLIARETLRLCAISVRACQLTDISVLPFQGTALVGISVLVSLTLLITIVACCATGVWMTLRWQEIGLAMATSLGLLALTLVPLILFFLLYIDAALHIVIRYDSPLSIVLTLPVIAVMGAIPHLLVTDTAWNRSPRWAWHNLANRGGTTGGGDPDPAIRRLSSLIQQTATPVSGWLSRRLFFAWRPRSGKARGRSTRSSIPD